MENIIKGWFTSLLGAALMLLAIVEWWSVENKSFYNVDVIVPLIAGFSLFQMKDQVSVWINQLVSIALEKLKDSTNLFQKKQD